MTAKTENTEKQTIDFSYPKPIRLPLSSMRKICKQRDTILKDEKLHWRKLKYKSTEDYIIKRKKAYLKIYLLARSNQYGWHLIPMKKVWYTNNKNQIPAYITYHTVKDSLDVLVNNDILIWKRGNKKLDTRGKLKWTAEKRKHFTDIEYENLFNTSGFTSEIKFNYPWVFDKEKYEKEKSEIRRKHPVTGESVHYRFASKKAQKQLDELNVITRRWGFHYRNRIIQYKQVFNYKEPYGGRFYSDFQNLSKDERMVWLPPGFVETDAHASHPNILYHAVTGNFFDGDVYDAISYSLGIPLEYRSLSKRAVMTCLNTNRDKSIKSVRQSLSMNGHHLTNRMLRDMTRGQAEAILNSLPIKRKNFESIISLKIQVLIEKGELKGKLSDYKKTIQWLNRARFLHMTWGWKNGIDPSVQQVLLKPGEVLEAVETVHSDIAPYFHKKGLGQRLTYLESQVLFQVVKWCYEKNIPVLTIHDAYYSYKQHSKIVYDLLLKAMAEVSVRLRHRLFGLKRYLSNRDFNEYDRKEKNNCEHKEKLGVRLGGILWGISGGSTGVIHTKNNKIDYEFDDRNKRRKPLAGGEPKWMYSKEEDAWVMVN